MKKLITVLLIIIGNNAFSQGETCATAIATIPGSYTSDGPVTGGGSSVFSGNTNSDWYIYTATATGNLTVSSCGDGDDTRLYVFSGTCGALVNIVDNDDDCNANETATFPVTIGTDYFIEWTDEYDTNPISFDVTFTIPPPVTVGGPTCATAVPVVVGVYLADGPATGGGASTYSGDTNSDWFEFTATATGDLTISSCGDGDDTKLFVFTGICGALVNIVDNDDDCNSNETATFAVTNGTVYLIEWSDAYDTNPIDFELSFSIPPVVTVGGPTCATAVPVVVGVYRADGPATGGGASAFSGDTNSDWFEYTATGNGALTVSSCGDGDDTKLFVFTGTCGALVNIVDNDDDCNSNETATFAVTNGTVYLIEWSDAYDINPIDFELSFTISVGVEDVVAGKGNVYPNPTTGKINIDLEDFNEPNINVKIMNSSGSIVYNSNLNKNGTVDLSQEANGLYFVVITGDNTSVVRRIIKN